MLGQNQSEAALQQNKGKEQLKSLNTAKENVLTIAKDFEAS